MNKTKKVRELNRKLSDHEDTLDTLEEELKEGSKRQKKLDEERLKAKMLRDSNPREREKEAKENWKKIKELTPNSKYNHSYVRRPVNAHREFYALWADGDAFGPSESCLYFTDREGSHVWRLPPKMDSEMQRPEIAW